MRLFEGFLFLAGEAAFDLFHIFGGRGGEFQLAGEFGLDFLNAGQAGAERFGQGAHELVFGDADGFINAGEGLLGHEAVLGFAKQEADGGLVVWGLDLGVNCTEVC